MNKTFLLGEHQEIELSNNEFLGAIFGDAGGDQRPLCCSFIGHSGKVSSEKWAAIPWLKEKSTFASQGNNYFSLASFNPNSEKRYRRQKRCFAAQHAVMLDDVGTKAVGLDRLTLTPSWLLETSPGNFQAGYIFREPITDGVIVERLMKSIISAGLCDPGADGPLSRLARLPVGNNGKHDPPFKCRLVKWHPERRYSIEEIIDGLQLDFSLIEDRHLAVTHQNNQRKNGTDDELYIPRCLENPVLAKLKEQGLYLRPRGNKTHDIDCPWQHQHTDGLGGGTAYFEPSESYPIGGFSCLHGHCRDRHMRDLREYLGVSKAEAKNRSTIRMPAGHLGEIVDHCEKELANAGSFYNRGGLIVNAVADKESNNIIFLTLSLQSIVRHLSNLVCFERPDQRRGWTPCDPPERYCRILYDAQNYPHLPALRGIAKQPYLRPDGSLVTQLGYDEATGIFGLFDDKEFDIPDAPSRKDAEHALEIINNRLEEFCFKTETDHSAALSAILTAVVRPSLSFAPMYHVRATQISAGKSHLIKLFTAFATAKPASAFSFPRDDEECQKLLLAYLLTAPAVMNFDNMTTDLVPHKSLCSALTEESLTGRILGVSKIATVGTRTLFLSSGNNVDPVKDMTRRTITIQLDPDCENPANRKFKEDPVDTVCSDRGHFVSLALTIIMAWIAAGRPRIDVPTLASYGEWSDLCRQPLLWLGCVDPAKSIFHAIAHDSEREILGLLLHLWHGQFGSQPLMIRKAVNKCDDALLEVFMDIAGERDYLNKHRLGKWISRNAGRPVDGLKFEKDSSTRSAEAWRVLSVKSVPVPPVV